MRLAIAALCGLFLAATLAGCGGSGTSATPPAEAKAGPPPGAPGDMTKLAKDAKKK